MSDKVACVIDCDPGHDDFLALVLAHRLARVEGVTTVFGNAPLKDTTANALGIVALLGAETPVMAGSSVPLRGEPQHALHVHGIGGLEGVTLPAHERLVRDEHAVDYLLRIAKTVSALKLIALGPLTNVALAIRKDPEFALHLDEIVFMGGGTFGNVTPVAEFNIWADPEALGVVLASGAKLRMVGLDVTHQVQASEETVATLLGGDAVARCTAASLTSLHSRLLPLTGERRTAMHDPLAVLAAVRPELLVSRKRRVQVELESKLTRGMTVVDRRVRAADKIGGDEAPNVEVCEEVDSVAAMAAIVDGLLSGSLNNSVS